MWADLMGWVGERECVRMRTTIRLRVMKIPTAVERKVVEFLERHGREGFFPLKHNHKTL